jgi:hypothetical protein
MPLNVFAHTSLKELWITTTRINDYGSVSGNNFSKR